jgi:hypothetical protein
MTDDPREANEDLPDIFKPETPDPMMPDQETPFSLPPLEEIKRARDDTDD